MAVLMKYNPLTGKLDLVEDLTGPPAAVLEDGSVPFIGTEGQPAFQEWHADEGDDDADKWRILAEDNGHFRVDSFATGSWVALLRLLNSGHLIPGTDTAQDLGEDTTPLHWRTIYLGGNGSDRIIDVPDSADMAHAATRYIIWGGGGQLGGGEFKIEMQSAVGGGENLMTMDLGAVYFAAALDTNDFAIQAYSGMNWHRFISAFGGFNNPEYGWVLDRVVNIAQNTGKTLYFDNADSISDFRRSIDFRIAGVNKLSIENDGTMLVGSNAVVYQINPNQVSFGGALNIDYFTFTGQSAAYNALMQVACESTGAYAGIIYSANAGSTLECSSNGISAVANLLTYSGLFGSVGPATLNIGEKIGETGLGTVGYLNTIDFYFNNAIEMQLQPDLLIFNNGAVDTQIDWATSGELGLQVALADIIRLFAAKAECYQDFIIPSDTKKIFLGASQDLSMEYDGTRMLIDVSLQNPSDIDIDCGTDKTVRLVETVWDDVRVPGLSVEAPGPNAPTLGAFLGAGGLLAWRFTGVGVLVNEVYFTVQLPHGYKEGTDIVPHVHWTPTDANAGNVVWQLEYSWQNVNGGAFPATTTITTTQAASGTAWDSLVANFAAISGTGKQISSQLVCRLFRDPAHASDTYGFDAALVEVDFHFEVETLGSRQPFVK